MRSKGFIVFSIYAFGVFSNAFAFEDVSMWVIHNHTNSPLVFACYGRLPSESAPRFISNRRPIAPYGTFRQIWTIDSEMEAALWECRVNSSFELAEITPKVTLEVPWRGVARIHVQFKDGRYDISRQTL